MELNFIYPWMVRLLDRRREDKKFRRVVLPLPEGPRIAVNDEWGIRPLCGCRMSFYSAFIRALIYTE
jgi:hypothetical protein